MTRTASIASLASLLVIAISGTAESRASSPDEAPQLATSSRASNTLEGLAIELRDLPVGLHRRAADTLELERERAGSPWVDARLSTAVVPMFRPSVPTPTHYEIGVVGPDGEARGYMVLSNGRHDYPVAFSTSSGPRRSTELLAKLPAGESPARIHYLSPVSTVAESAGGKMLANLGGLPPKVLRAQMEWLDLPASDRLGHTHYDAQAGAVEQSQPEHEIELGEWSSWPELADGYAENYAVLHEALRRGASDDWQAEDDFRESGEGLQSGWFREVPLLGRGGVRVELRGNGATYVRTRIDERPYEGDSALMVFVEDIPGDDVYDVEITLRYGDGSSELHTFAVTKKIEYPTARPELGALPSTHLAAPTAVAAAPECRKVVLRSPWDTYVFARDGGGSTLEAGGGWIGSWEVLTLHRSGRHHVQFQTRTGDWVYAPGGGGGTLRADGLNGGGDALFQRNRYKKGIVAFRTRNGRNYIQAPIDGGVLNTTPTAVGDWERFELEYCEPSRIEGRWAGNDPIDAYRKVRKYGQISGKVGPNASSCASGCGATVWAMVFGWADHMAELRDTTWLGAANLYRSDGKKTGAKAGAPEWMWTDVPQRLRTRGGEDRLVDGPANIIIEIRNYMNDWGAAGCTMSGSRFTVPHIMAQAVKYLQGRVNTDLTADYDGASVMTHEGKMKAKRRLDDEQVVAIGIGHYSHYPLAYGYEDAQFAKWNEKRRRWTRVSRHKRFVTHMGWGHPGSSNVPFDTWFQGWIDPPAYATSATTANGSAQAPPKTLPKAPRPLNPKRKPMHPAPTPLFPK